MNRLVIFSLLGWAGGVLAQQDRPLSQVLIDGEGWQMVSDGHKAADGLCADARGNLYFSDVRGGQAIYKIDLDGAVTDFIKDVAGASGLQWGPDGKLYACLSRGRMVVRFDGHGKMEILAKEVRPNDLVVTCDGNVYFTQTPEGEIRRIDPEGRMTVVSKDVMAAPNGITLSPGQRSLAVSDHGGRFVWVFRIEADGSLADPQNHMVMRTPHGGPGGAKGDGMASDADGRYYVSTDLGLQVYDQTGRLDGVIAKPQDAGLVSVAFAGPGLAYLYVACGDKVYRRKTKTKGLLFFEKPKRNQLKK